MSETPKPVTLAVSNFELQMAEGIVPAMYIRMAEIAKDDPKKLDENFGEMIRQIATLLAASRVNDPKILTAMTVRFVDYCMASEDAQSLMKVARTMSPPEPGRN